MKSFEITVALFEKCNLCCSYCFSKRKNMVIDFNKILSIPKEIEKDLFPIFKEKGIEQFNITTWGGELFSDDLPDALFDVYKKYIDIWKKDLKEFNPQLQVQFHWYTNGVWRKWERVRDLMGYCSGKLLFSYDAVGRFTKPEQIELLKNSINNLKFFTENIGITLTKRNIQEYIKGDKFLESFPDIRIDSNYYWPNRDWEKDIATDNDLLDWFLWGIKNKKFNFSTILGLFKGAFDIPDNKHCKCKNSARYNNGIFTQDCVLKSSIVGVENFLNYNGKILDTKEKFDLRDKIFYQKRKCLTCPYFKNCPMGCIGSQLFKYYQMNDDCPFRKAMEYIQQNNKEYERDFYEYLQRTN